MPRVDEFRKAIDLPKSHRPPGPPERQIECRLCHVAQSAEVMRRASDVIKDAERGYVCDYCAERRHSLGMLP